MDAKRRNEELLFSRSYEGRTALVLKNGVPIFAYCLPAKQHWPARSSRNWRYFKKWYLSPFFPVFLKMESVPFFCLGSYAVDPEPTKNKAPSSGTRNLGAARRNRSFALEKMESVPIFSPSRNWRSFKKRYLSPFFPFSQLGHTEVKHFVV